VCVIAAMIVRLRKPIGVETFLPRSSSCASFDASTGVEPLLTE